MKLGALFTFKDILDHRCPRCRVGKIFHHSIFLGFPKMFESCLVSSDSWPAAGLRRFSLTNACWDRIALPFFDAGNGHMAVGHQILEPLLFTDPFVFVENEEACSGALHIDSAL
jgi:hypothetical protein